jgi:hypothetical protein
MAYATVEDVTARLPRALDDDETRVVTARLGDAELVLKSRIPDLNAKVAAGTIDQDVVVMIEAEAVLRLIRNPEGYQQESDGSYSYMLRSDVSSGRIEILPTEWAMLGITGSVYTISPYVEVPHHWFGPFDRDVWRGWLG